MLKRSTCPHPHTATKTHRVTQFRETFKQESKTRNGDENSKFRFYRQFAPQMGYIEQKRLPHLVDNVRWDKLAVGQRPHRPPFRVPHPSRLSRSRCHRFSPGRRLLRLPLLLPPRLCVLLLPLGIPRSRRHLVRCVLRRGRGSCCLPRRHAESRARRRRRCRPITRRRRERKPAP